MDLLPLIVSNLHLVTKKSLSSHDTYAQGLEELYREFVGVDIDINFDSKTFFITRNSTVTGIDIGPHMDKRLVTKILHMINSKEMGENIKNTSQRIHFRMYKYNTVLDGAECYIQCKVFLDAAGYVGVTEVLSFLVTKRVELLNEILRYADDDDLQCKTKERLQCVETVITSVLAHKNQTCPDAQCILCQRR